MAATYWHRQTPDSPLYPELEWLRPETRARGGRLLIVGGNHHSFRRVAESYEAAQKAQAGEIRVAVPDSLKPTLTHIIPEAEYVKSNASGGIGLDAENQLLAFAGWSQAVVVAGDMGRNSETPQIMDKFINRYSGLLAITADALEATAFSYDHLLAREQTLLVCSLAQLQRIFKDTAQTTAITSTIGVVKLVEALHELTAQQPCALTVYYENQLITALNGEVVTTPFKWQSDDPNWRVPVATRQVTFWMQHAEAAFKALTFAQL